MKRKFFILAFAVLALLLAGCSSSFAGCDDPANYAGGDKIVFYNTENGKYNQMKAADLIRAERKEDVRGIVRYNSSTFELRDVPTGKLVLSGNLLETRKIPGAWEDFLLSEKYGTALCDPDFTPGKGYLIQNAETNFYTTDGIDASYRPSSESDIFCVIRITPIDNDTNYIQRREYIDAKTGIAMYSCTSMKVEKNLPLKSDVEEINWYLEQEKKAETYAKVLNPGFVPAQDAGESIFCFTDGNIVLPASEQDSVSPESIRYVAEASFTDGNRVKYQVSVKDLKTGKTVHEYQTNAVSRRSSIVSDFYYSWKRDKNTHIMNTYLAPVREPGFTASPNASEIVIYDAEEGQFTCRNNWECAAEEVRYLATKSGNNVEYVDLLNGNVIFSGSDGNAGMNNLLWKTAEYHIANENFGDGTKILQDSNFQSRIPEEYRLITGADTQNVGAILSTTSKLLSRIAYYGGSGHTVKGTFDTESVTVTISSASTGKKLLTKTITAERLTPPRQISTSFFDTTYYDVNHVSDWAVREWVKGAWESYLAKHK